MWTKTLLARLLQSGLKSNSNRLSGLYLIHFLQRGKKKKKIYLLYITTSSQATTDCWASIYKGLTAIIVGLSLIFISRASQRIRCRTCSTELWNPLFHLLTLPFRAFSCPFCQSESHLFFLLHAFYLSGHHIFHTGLGDYFHNRVFPLEMH